MKDLFTRKPKGIVIVWSLLIMCGTLMGSYSLNPLSPAAALSRVSITVSELYEAVAFYTERLLFEKARAYRVAGQTAQRPFSLHDSTLVVHATEPQLGQERIERLAFDTAKLGPHIPADSRSNDLWHWHTSIRVPNVDEAYDQMLQANYSLISSGKVSLDDTAWNIEKGFIVHDPDGHAFFLCQ